MLEGKFSIKDRLDEDGDWIEGEEGTVNHALASLLCALDVWDMQDLSWHGHIATATATLIEKMEQANEESCEYDYVADMDQSGFVIRWSKSQ